MCLDRCISQYEKWIRRIEWGITYLNYITNELKLFYWKEHILRVFGWFMLSPGFENHHIISMFFDGKMNEVSDV